MSYVPTHLKYGPRQADGYPKGISEETKRWAEKFTRAYLEEAKGHSQPWVDLEEIRYHLFNFPLFDEHRPEDLKGKPLLDFQNAFADRALRAVDARQVYVLG